MEWKATLPFSIFIALCCLRFTIASENSTVTTSSTTSTPETTVTTVTTTTQTPEQVCEGLSNVSCEHCVKGHSKCYYCETSKQCTYFSSLIPGHEKCGSLDKVKWSTCSINFKVMIIGVSVTAGILLVGIVICCCCCCRKRKNYIWARDQAKWERQRDELKMKSDERRMERQSRTDEIRRKYGLMKTGSNYQRFDA